MRSVKVTNISPLDVYYTWSFTHHQISFEGKDEDEGMSWTFLQAQLSLDNFLLLTVTANSLLFDTLSSSIRFNLPSLIKRNSCKINLFDEAYPEKVRIALLNTGFKYRFYIILIFKGIGRDLSDGSDEERSMMDLNIQPSPSTNQQQSRPQTSRPISSSSSSSLSRQQRRRTSSKIKRPSSAPPSSMITPQQQERYGGITWSEIKLPPVNVGIEEVSVFFILGYVFHDCAYLWLRLILHSFMIYFS